MGSIFQSEGTIFIQKETPTPSPVFSPVLELSNEFNYLLFIGTSMLGSIVAPSNYIEYALQIFSIN